MVTNHVPEASRSGWTRGRKVIVDEKSEMGSYQIHRKVKVRKGYEITTTLTDGDKTRSKTFFHSGENEPSDEKLAGKLTKMAERFAEKNLIVPDIQMMKSEVEGLLVRKGYLEEGQTLEELPDSKAG